MILNNDLLNKRIKLYSMLLNRNKIKLVENLNNENFLLTLSTNLFKIIIYSKLLKYEENYKQMCGDCVKYYLESFKIKKFSIFIFKDLINPTFISMDDNLIQSVEKVWNENKEEYLDTNEKFEKFYYYYIETLFNLYNNKNDLDLLNKLEEFGNKLKVFNSISNICKSIVENDLENFYENISKGLKEHKSAYSGGSEKESLDGLISFRILILIKIAKKRGMEFEIEKIPEKLREYIPEVLLK